MGNQKSIPGRCDLGVMNVDFFLLRANPNGAYLQSNKVSGDKTELFVETKYFRQNKRMCCFLHFSILQLHE